MGRRTRELKHPLHQVPSVAEVLGYYIGKNGRNIGEEFLFCDGHHCYLTYAEIAALAVVETAVNEVEHDK